MSRELSSALPLTEEVKVAKLFTRSTFPLVVLARNFRIKIIEIPPKKEAKNNRRQKSKDITLFALCTYFIDNNHIVFLLFIYVSKWFLGKVHMIVTQAGELSADGPRFSVEKRHCFISMASFIKSGGIDNALRA